MDTGLVNLAGAVLMNKLTNNGSSSSGNTGTSANINVKGTILSTLGTVANTKTYMENFSRYNQYLTSSYGAAQMAADRYSSLKERTMMSIEYYLTPEQKGEVVMYINPESMTISTSKVKDKVYTRGGIYFHHYGDDVWTMKLQGKVGYSCMKGIEALAEVYHYSGALLKYQNISESTVHTNQISDSSAQNAMGGAQSGLAGMLNMLGNSGVGGFLNNALGTATDALGLTSKTTDAQGNPIRTNGASQDSLMNKVLGSVQSTTSALMGGYSNKAISSLMQQTIGVTGTTNTANYFNTISNAVATGFSGVTSKNIINGIASDMVTSVMGGKGNALGSVMGQFASAFGVGAGALAGMTTGDYQNTTTVSMPQSATSGNYYSMGTLSATDLNNVVSSVSAYNKSRQVDKGAVENSLSDITDQLTDLYRPRQIIIYFDDRAYVGHFDSFSYSRTASTLLISYDMQFTITRQVVVGRQNLNSSSSSNGGMSDIKNLLIGSAIGSAMNSLTGK